MSNTKESPAFRLHEQMARLLNGTKAHRDEVTQILTSFLAVQVANYQPIERLDVWDAVVHTLDDMIEELSEALDGSMAVKN